MRSKFTDFFRKSLVITIAAALMVSVLCIGYVTVSADDEMIDGDVLFEENFDGVKDGSLPEGWKMNAELSSKGKASVEGGKLVIDGYNTGLGKVLLPDLAEETGDYSFECDVSFISSTNDSRWMSLIVRQQKTDEDYFHMCVRRTTTASNGVEFAQRTPGTWNVMTTGKSSVNLGLNKEVHIKISIVGTKVFEYVDNKLVINSDALEALRGIYTTGGLAIQAANAKITVDNVKVSKCTFKEDPLAGDKQYMNYNFLESKVIASAATIAEPSSADDIDSYLAMEKGPDNVILWVDNNGMIVSRDGTKEIGTLEEVREKISRRLMPVFGLRTAAAADRLVAFLKEQKLFDCMFISPDKDVLERVRKERKRSGGVLDLTEVPDLAPYKADPQLIVEAVNTSSAKTVLIPEDLLDKNGVEYVQHRLVTVWVKETAETPVMLHNSIQSGANGILTDTPSDLINAYKFYDRDVTVLVRNPLVIGHRGLPSSAPENTIESAKEAVAAGADCIELDVRLSKDGVLYVLHDLELGTTTDGSGSINSKTSEELKRVSVVKSSSYGTFKNYAKVKLPTLKEFFESVKDTDVMFFIEIKEEKNDITQKICELVEELGLRNRCSMITFLESQIPVFQKALPGISTGRLMSTPSAATHASVVNKVISDVVPKNSTFNPSNLYSDKVIRGLMYRGVTAWPWTYNKTNTRSAYLMGVGGITTDFAGEAGDIPTGINIGGRFELTLSVSGTESRSFEFDPTVSTRLLEYSKNGENRFGEVIGAPELIILEGSEYVKVDGDKVTATAPGTARLIYRLETSTNPSGDQVTAGRFSLYTQVITVNVSEEPVAAPTDAPAEATEAPAKSGCGSAVTALIALPVIAVACVVLRKKH